MNTFTQVLVHLLEQLLPLLRLPLAYTLRQKLAISQKMSQIRDSIIRQSIKLKALKHKAIHHKSSYYCE